jgi:RNA recognition motif-containing protein
MYLSAGILYLYRHVKLLMVKLFVGGFPLNIQEIKLVELISPYGTVSTIKIIRDRKTGKCKGYAFIEMTDMEGAEQAISALDGIIMDDRVLSLNVTEDNYVALNTSISKKAKPVYSKIEKPNEIVKKKRPRKQL